MEPPSAAGGGGAAPEDSPVWEPQGQISSCWSNDLRAAPCIPATGPPRLCSAPPHVPCTGLLEDFRCQRCQCQAGRSWGGTREGLCRGSL